MTALLGWTVWEMIHPGGPKFSSELVEVFGIFTDGQTRRVGAFSSVAGLCEAGGRRMMYLRPHRGRLQKAAPEHLAYQWLIGPAGTATCACWASYSVQSAGAGPLANGAITSS